MLNAFSIVPGVGQDDVSSAEHFDPPPDSAEAQQPWYIIRKILSRCSLDNALKILAWFDSFIIMEL